LATAAIVRRFEGRLREALGARGIALHALRLEGFDYLQADRDTAPVPPDAGVLLVGLDGADWEIVDPLMEAGRLPNLAGLVRQGARAKLLSITPMLSPVIWTSIATGVEPSRHGVMDFLVPAASGGSEPVTSRARKAPAVWDILSTAGVPVAVTGWWATWPATEVRGAMVTDRLAYQLFGFSADPRDPEGKTWPPELYDRIQPLIVPPDRVSWSDVVPYLEGTRRTAESFDRDEHALLDEFRTLLASGRTYLDIALAVRQERPPRFEAVYFEGTDTVGHLFMPYRPPHLPGIEGRRYASFHAVVDRYYETADLMLGRLLEGRDRWTVIVCSDHGFASDATRPRTTDSRIGHGAAADWHRRFGIFVMSGPGVRRGIKLEEVSVYDIAPTILALFDQPVPRSWPGRVLAGALAPGRFASRPVRYRGDPAAPPAQAGSDPGADEEARELREKLQSLGYVATDVPQPMTTENNRGVAYLAEGRYAEAAEAFRKAISQEPRQATLWVNLGIALRFAGKTEEARTWLDKAYHVSEAERAAGHQLAQLDLEAGDLAAAERRLRSILDREPGASEVWNSLGIVLERRGREGEAARQYETAARLDPDAAEPRNNLGNLAKRALDTVAAERWYRAAIDADPYFMGAYNNLAIIYQDRGEIDRAIELYDRALAKAPTNAVVLNNLGSLYYTVGDLDAAHQSWLRASAADPAYTSPLNNLAGLALARGNDAEAEDLLGRALALDPAYGDAHINRSLIARRRGDLARARRELDAAEKDPAAAGSAALQRGYLELAEGRLGDAVRAFERALRRLGERPEILNGQGEALLRLGDEAGALRAWKRSVQIAPGQSELQVRITDLENKE
jgi:Tfp pilus assembly protein PilF/predicted AlkP superfamily phosphohydrolase/phosphomutase